MTASARAQLNAALRSLFDRLPGCSEPDCLACMERKVDLTAVHRLIDELVTGAASEALSELAREAHTIACAKGFWGDKDPNEAAMVLGPPEAERLAAKLTGIHGEVSEAYEDLRRLRMNISLGPDGKPEGFPTELADVLLTTLSLAHALGLDIARAVELKLAFNRTRGHLHGGKVL